MGGNTCPMPDEFPISFISQGTLTPRGFPYAQGNCNFHSQGISLRVGKCHFSLVNLLQKSISYIAIITGKYVGPCIDCEGSKKKFQKKIFSKKIFFFKFFFYPPQSIQSPIYSPVIIAIQLLLFHCKLTKEKKAFPYAQGNPLGMKIAISLHVGKSPTRQCTLTVKTEMHRKKRFLLIMTKM